jgi:uncharacterized glyoxalase superfamily protein PhnB
MTTNRSAPSATVVPVLVYPDVLAAVRWLTEALGFRERVRIGEGHRSQLQIGVDGAVVVAEAGGDRRPPRPGEVTHEIKVRVDDVDAVCASARALGAEVLEEPVDRGYGERECTLVDPAGHRWQLTRTLRDVAPEEWGGRTSGD